MKENWEIRWKDYYKILQIDPQAEVEIVKAAYDRLARRYHPDVNKDADAATRMKDLNEAFETLSNPGKRSRYFSAYIGKLRQAREEWDKGKRMPVSSSSSQAKPQSASQPRNQ